MCDTFIIPSVFTADGSLLFGKNSDREPNEAQALEYYPSRHYGPGRQVKCTYITIPQKEQTHAAILCRPFWMWGAEMGANEHGVVIGNEAVWSRVPVCREPRLTGMDLLRLALERSANAESALETIVQLLADHGQGGICGYRDRNMSYHNSFIIADPTKAWVLETAGPYWAARKITTPYAISNGYTIEEDFQRSHPDLIQAARNNGWCKKGDEFSFCRIYSDRFYTYFSASAQRRKRTRCLLEKIPDKKSAEVKTAFSILRDHGEKDYHPDRHLLGSRICAHAGYPLTRLATQTTGSMVAHFGPKKRQFWFTGTSSPCIGIFKPVQFGSSPLPDKGLSPGAVFDETCHWWLHEKLHRQVLQNYSRRAPLIQGERNQLESTFLQECQNNHGDISHQTKDAFNRSRAHTKKWFESIDQSPIKQSGNFVFRNFWKKMNKSANIICK